VREEWNGEREASRGLWGSEESDRESRGVRTGKGKNGRGME